MEWTVVTVIIALVGFLVAIIKPIVSLTSSITKLTAVVDHLQENLNGLTTKNSKAHERLWDHNEKQDGILSEHEKRLAKMEEKEDCRCEEDIWQ